jgi:tetratricopeptide (TPR) repeat protein
MRIFRPAALLMLVTFLSAGCAGDATQEEEVSRQLAEGRQLMDSLNFNQALALYEQAYKDLPEDDAHWPEAAFGYATSLWHQTPPNAATIAEAVEVFQSISRLMPGTEWARASRLSWARILMLRDFPGDAENPEAAMPILEALTREGGMISHEALVRLAECHRMRFADLKELQAARDLLTDWLERHPENPLASLMWEQLAWLELESFNDNGRAIAALEQAEARGFADSSKKGTLLWLLGQLLQERGEHERAALYYTRLIKEVPSSGRAYEAQMVLGSIRDTVPGMESLKIPDINLFMNQ